MPITILFLFFLLHSSSAISSRRILHEPLFPVEPPPIAFEPKYPFSSNPSPFFPSPSPPFLSPPPPPPPPLTTTPTIPPPNTPSSLSKPSSNSKHVVPAVVVPLVFVTVIAVAVAVFYRRRRRKRSPAGDEIHFLADLERSRERVNGRSTAETVGSPELQPLPPLLEVKKSALSSPSSSSSGSAPSPAPSTSSLSDEDVPTPPPPPLPQNSRIAHPPPPPPPPFSLTGAGKPKLKPLHWDKVRASSDRAMVWDHLRSSSFQLNEEMIETLFVCNPASGAAKEAAKGKVPPSPKDEARVLDPKKSQNIAILLRALNVTKEEVCEALLEGNAESLGTEMLETLLKMEPSGEEEQRLKQHKEEVSPSKLGPAEKFLKAILDVPWAFKRADAMLYVATFDAEIADLTKSFETLKAACEELRSSRMFLTLLEAVLKTGNRMNVGTDRGGAQAFKLDTLLKLVDVKGTDGKTTLLHFVVQEMIRLEGSRTAAAEESGLEIVAGLGEELASVKKAAAIDEEWLAGAAARLARGMRRVEEVLNLVDRASGAFSGAMERFLRRAEGETAEIEARERATFDLVKEITEYFHGDSAVEEKHPLRIFMVVRDFLAVLDRVCKEVGKINQERTNVSWTRQLPAPANPSAPSP